FSLFRLLVSPDGKFLVALQSDTSVAVPTTEGEGRQHARISVTRPPETRFLPGAGSVLATLTEDGRQMAWRTLPAQFESRTSFPGHPDNATVRSFDFSPDGKIVAVLGETGEVTLADVASGEVRTRFMVPKRAQWLEQVRYAPDGNTLLLFT